MKYLITTYDRDDVTDHANYCEAHQIPCIYALVEQDECTLFVECAKLTGPGTQALEAHEAEFREFVNLLVSRHPEPAWIDAGPPTWFWFHHLPASAGEEVAEETYEFLSAILDPIDDK